MDNLTPSSEMSPRVKSFFKWILVLGIVIVSNLFFNYAIDVFYDEPLYEDYCKQEQVRPLVKTQTECVSKGGQWTETPMQREYPSGKVIPIEEQISGYCDQDFVCRQDYDDSRRVYNRNVFVILVVLGVALIVGSYYVATFGAVSLGFSLAGVVSLVIGTMRYWSDMDDKIRVIVLGLALVALVWYGIKKFRD